MFVGGDIGFALLGIQWTINNNKSNSIFFVFRSLLGLDDSRICWESHQEASHSTLKRIKHDPKFLDMLLSEE